MYVVIKINMGKNKDKMQSVKNTVRFPIELVMPALATSTSTYTNNGGPIILIQIINRAVIMNRI